VASWSEVEAAAPELAAAARGFLAARRHLVLATVRRDGAPRVSGIEAQFLDGELWLGMMWRSRKALDARRDPRFALHSGSADPPGWTGDATVSGLLEEVTDPERIAQVLGASGGEAPPGPAHLFRADIGELTVVRLGEPADHLVFEVWREGEVPRRMRRS
jgi:hypothetical protein